MNNGLAPRKSLDDEWLAMNAALAKVGLAKPVPVKRQARLIVALDLTGSREHALRQARIATTQMFEALKSVGSIAVKMLYYRGTDECKATQWHDDPAQLIATMQRLSCESGNSQIARVLRLVLAETEPISGVVLVVDQREEHDGDLIALAQELGAKGKPLYIFHEVSDTDERSLDAKPLFKKMALESRGQYVEFRADSGTILREMLSSVAAFSAGGAEGIKRIIAGTPEAKQLQTRLLLGDGKKR